MLVSKLFLAFNSNNLVPLVNLTCQQIYPLIHHQGRTTSSVGEKLPCKRIPGLILGFKLGLKLVYFQQKKTARGINRGG